MAVDDQTSSRNTTFVLTVSQSLGQNQGDYFNIAQGTGFAYDSTQMTALLQPYSNNIIHLADKTATPKNILKAMHSIVSNPACKLFIFHYSGPATGTGSDSTPKLCLPDNQFLSDSEIWDYLEPAQCKTFCIFACANLSMTEENRRQPDMFKHFSEYAAASNFENDIVAWSACSDGDVGHVLNCDKVNYFDSSSSPGHDFIRLLKKSYAKELTYSQLWDKIKAAQTWNDGSKKYTFTPIKHVINDDFSRSSVFSLKETGASWNLSKKPSVGTGLFEHSAYGDEQRTDVADGFMVGEWYLYGKVKKWNFQDSSVNIITSVNQKKLKAYADSQHIPLIVYVDGAIADDLVLNNVLRSYEWQKYFREKKCLLANVHYEAAGDNNAETDIFGDRSDAWPCFRVWYDGKEVGSTKYVPDAEDDLIDDDIDFDGEDEAENMPAESLHRWLEEILEGYSPSSADVMYTVSWFM